MLNFGKLLSVLLVISMLNACGYQSPNSDKFPHKHIQKLSPSSADLEFKWLSTADDMNRKAINENYIVYSCPEIDKKQGGITQSKICTYDLNHDQQIKPYAIVDPKEHLIEQIVALNQDHFLITLVNKQYHSDNLIKAYLFNPHTQTLMPMTPFSYTAFSHTILEQMLQEKTYQKKVSEYGTTVYFDPQYISAKEAEEAQKEHNRQQQSLIEDFIEIFKTKPQKIERDFSPTNYSAQPAEPFNLKLLQQLKPYIQQHQAECYLIIDHETQLLKTSQSYIYSHDFSQFLPQLENELELHECKKPTEFSPVNAKYLKYQSIDDIHGSGNHYIFWFTPIGYDVFEIKQHGQNKQFKLPIDTAWVYQIKNKLIIISDQTYFIIPVSE